MSRTSAFTLMETGVIARSRSFERLKEILSDPKKTDDMLEWMVAGTPAGKKNAGKKPKVENKKLC